MFGRSKIWKGCSVGIVAGISLLFCGIWMSYHFICQPFLVEDGAIASGGLLVGRIAGVALFNLFWFLAFWSYLRACLTDPGTPKTSEWEDWRTENTAEIRAAETAQDEDEDGLRRRGWTTKSLTFCKQCSRARPSRAHHCAQCGCCILRMDHHCPWIGNCVGWRNHKYFILLCWWGFLGAVTCLLTMKNPNAFEAVGIGNSQSQLTLAVVLVLVCTVIACVTACIFGLALTMAARNTSMVEDIFSGDNPFQLPSYLENLKQLMGPIDIFILIPTAPSTRLRGTAFPFGPAGKSAPAEYGSTA